MACSVLLSLPIGAEPAAEHVGNPPEDLEKPWNERPWESSPVSESDPGETPLPAEEKAPWEPRDDTGFDDQESGLAPAVSDETGRNLDAGTNQPTDRTQGRWEIEERLTRTQGRRYRSEGLWERSLARPDPTEVRWARSATQDRSEGRWKKWDSQQDPTEGRWDAEHEPIGEEEAEESPGLERSEQIRQRVGGRWLEEERIGERTQRLTVEIGRRWEEAGQRWEQLASAEAESTTPVENAEAAVENEQEPGENPQPAGEKSEDQPEETVENDDSSQDEDAQDAESDAAEPAQEQEEDQPLTRDMAAIRAKLERQLEQYRKQRAARRSEANQRAFIGEDGVPMLTNRPERYRRKPGAYTEIMIEYEPIVVQDRYRKAKSYDYKMSDLQELVSYNARKYKVSESLIYGMIKVESDFKPDAVSPAGARGLMQLMPGTAAEMGVSDIFDVAQNIAGGTQYIAKMLQLFDNDLKLALAAYNAGPEAVKKHGGIPPYKETQDYVRRVLIYYRGFGSGRASAPRVSLAKFKRPSASYVPEVDKKRFTIRFHSGLTQVADKVVDNGSYYYVKYGGRISRVRKDFVKEVVEPA